MTETHKQRQTYKCNDIQTHSQKIETDTQRDTQKQRQIVRHHEGNKQRYAKGLGFMNQTQKDSHVDNNYKFAINSLQ